MEDSRDKLRQRNIETGNIGRIRQGPGGIERNEEKAVHAWQRELSGRESRGPQMSFCAKGKHRLVCLSNRACEATVVVVVYVVLPVEQGISGANVPTTYQSACRKCTAFSVWSPKSQAVTLHFAASHTATNDFFFHC